MDINSDGQMEYREQVVAAGMTSTISRVLSPMWTSGKTDSQDSYPC